MASVDERLGEGIAHHNAGRLDEAERAYREVIAAEPRYADAMQFLGLVALARGDAARAVAEIERAIALNPDTAVYHYNLGAARRALEDFPGAIKAYRRAIALAPELVQAHNNLGNALRQSGNAADAVECLREAIRLRPDYAEAHLNLGGALQERGRLDEAIAEYHEALKQAPALAEANYNLGAAQFLRGQLDLALANLKRAIELRPNYAQAWSNLGVVMQAYGAVGGARDAWRRAAELDPNDTTPRRNLLGAMLYEPTTTNASLWAAHQEFGAAMAARVKAKLAAPANDRSPERRLKVGYVSSDLYEHPVGRNLDPVLANRSRDKFEVYAYADVAAPDGMTARLKGHVDRWRPTLGLSDEALARQVRADGIDILVLLAGRYDRNRPQIACWRPAPVQVSFHDPASSGLAEIDYLVADPVLAPKKSTERFSERVVRLPSFYIHEPLESAPPTGLAPALAGSGVTFGSFNNPNKLSSATLALWGDVLRAVPGARLKLKFKNWFATPAVRARALAGLGGVGPERVEFVASEATLKDHLILYNGVDIALDPFPFTGSTTTFEALWMGVPVVTLAGDRMASRWSASLLHSIGLDELVAPSPEAYVTIASGLARNHPKLKQLRGDLRNRVARSPMCNGRAKARQLERLYRAMWRRWCAGTGQ